MVLRGINLLPPVISTQQALSLYKKVAQIKTSIGKLNSELDHSIVNNQLIQALSLRESVQSTRIEGTQVTFADMIDEATKKNKSSEVTEVENHQKALAIGIERIRNGYSISTRLILQLHKILMDNETRGTTSSSGEFRKIQNFIGPTNRIEDAVYIPVDENLIGNYMSNWEHYVNSFPHPSFNKEVDENTQHLLDYDTDPLIKTAILHAQFESIHPFLDGNGRMGRILIVLSTMQDGLIDKPVFFVSEELEKERIRYYNKLNGVRGDNPEWFEWIDFFLDACQRMSDNMLNKLEKINDLASSGLKLINRDGNINTIWLSTFNQPYVTVQAVANKLGISVTTARKGLNTLADLNLLDYDKSKTKNRVYVNYDLINLL